MAEKKEEAEEAVSGGGGGGLASKLPLIVVGVNALVGMAALGFLTYTKVLYKRPLITEDTERVRLEKVHASPGPLTTPGLIAFEPITLNIEPVPSKPLPADGTNQQLEGKLHYATIGFSLEIRDGSQKEIVEKLRPLIMDRFMVLLGRKTIRDLTTVQGRYLLRTQILESINALAAKRSEMFTKDALATNIFFTQFIVQ